MAIFNLPTKVLEAAERLQELHTTHTVYNQNRLYVAVNGGLGPAIRNQTVNDLAILLDAVCRPDPTVSRFRG